VVFVDPSFDGKAVRQGHPSFLLPEEIDIQLVVQDFVRAFDGDPAAGESFLRACLVDYLTGAQPIPTGDRGAARQTRLGFLDLASKVDTTGMAQLISFATDKYGVATLTVADPDHLARLLAQAQTDYVVLFHSISAQRGSSAMAPTAVPMAPGGTLYVGGGEAKFATLSSEAYIWSRATRSILWHGYISGTHPIESKLTRNTVRGMAVRFALDVGAVLK
jgi:hypothetical protein